MSILRTGSNARYSANWDLVFGAKQKPAKQPTVQARKKTAKKKRTKARSPRTAKR